MNKIENYLGIANHDIQVANDNKELINYVASILCEIDDLQQENKKLNGAIQTYDILLKSNVEENKQLKERIEYLERSNNRREDTILEQRQEISNLEDNWNKLKEYLYNQIPTDKTVLTKYIKIFEVLDKIQKIEGSDINE